MEWLGKLLADDRPKSSIKLYFELLDTILNAAVMDKELSDNPCAGVRLSKVLSGLSSVPKWVPTEDQVLALLDAVPAQYRAMIWLGAGQGLRIGEAFAMEAGPRCLDPGRRELHVVQQLQQSRQYGGFYLAPPKSGSIGTVDLDAMVTEQLAAHVAQFDPVPVTLLDRTRDPAVTRVVPLLFTSAWRRPLTYKKWSEMWADWRIAAGWPAEGTFHSLRHFFATTLLANGVDSKAVQRALRHANLKITLDTYAHWIPKKDRPESVIGSALSRAAKNR
jgi:integrase